MPKEPTWQTPKMNLEKTTCSAKKPVGEAAEQTMNAEQELENVGKYTTQAPLLDNLSSIEFKIPKAGLSAGGILRHAKSVLESLFAKHSPMIWKVGYSHNVAWRWGNTLYGYQHAPEKWSNMIVLFETSEPYGPAMLEAALIDLYRGSWPQQ